MPRKTKFEIEQMLLGGHRITWLDGAKKAGLELNSAVRRRLFSELLKSKVRVVQGLPPEFIVGLSDAFSATDDPAATSATTTSSSKVAGPWRLVAVQTEGFGGINTWSGGAFTHALDGESLVIDGANGSGKSSLTGALIWALTGQRPREASASSDTVANSFVYDDAGQQIGGWPPLACYPDSPSTLGTSPFVSVKLTFKNPAGDEAVVERSLKNGAVSSSVDSRLEFPPILVETGLVMPSRLAQIRFGADQKQLKDAVQMLTGLDEIEQLGRFVADLCHKSYEYLGYSKRQKREDLFSAFSDAIEEAVEALQTVGRTTAAFMPADTREQDGPMATLIKELAAKATESLAVIQSDLEPTLDISKAPTQQQVASAITIAKSEMSEGLPGLQPWSMIANISSALSLEVANRLRQVVDTAKTQTNEALELHRRVQQDHRFQMKVIAAAWHDKHSSGSIESCPLCDQSLEKNQELSAELDVLRAAGALAQREFADNVHAILAVLDAAAPEITQKYRMELPSLQPKQDLEAALRARFVDHTRYSGCLTGLAGVIKTAIQNLPGDELAPWSAGDGTGLPPESKSLLNGIAAAERLLALSEWFDRNAPLWRSWWDQVTGEKLEPIPADSFAGKLAKLGEALTASAPYRVAAKSLREAWKYGETVDKIDMEQEKRQKIADQIDALKDLRKLAEAETKGAIEGLSTRMAAVLEDVHLVEKLKFHSTHVDKKTGVTVRAGFGAGLHIDASLIANASWMRALLWSFVFAVREEAVEQFGEDRLPLLVLDDPQATFDATHRHRWAQHIAALQKSTLPIQIMLATHDESFLAQLETAGVLGRRAFLVAPGGAIPSICLIDGDELQRAWGEVKTKKTPQSGRDFISKARIHTETLLKVMLRGEGDTRAMVLGELRKRVSELHDKKVTPWNRNIFDNLVGKLTKTIPAIQHMESSHHSTGVSLGVAEATDVESYWRGKLWPTLENAFRAIREYRLLHGESKALHAEPATVALPAGHDDVVKKIPLEIHGRASALTSAHADGNLTMTMLGLHQRSKIVLAKHTAYRVVTPTLEPVARPGDIVLVSELATPLDGSLVVAVCGANVLARRMQLPPDHPDIIVLTAQSVSPAAIAAPRIAHMSTISVKKIVGVLFDTNGFPVAAPTGYEVADCGGDAAVAKLTSNSVGLVQVSGHSAEPQVLDKQYLLIGPQVSAVAACKQLDGRPVIATDSNGMQYFKRLRAGAKGNVVLESLHAGGGNTRLLCSRHLEDKTLTSTSYTRSSGCCSSCRHDRILVEFWFNRVIGLFRSCGGHGPPYGVRGSVTKPIRVTPSLLASLITSVSTS